MEKMHIDVLLGTLVHARIIEGQVIKGNPDEPIASLSLLGWLLSGESPRHALTIMNFSSPFHCVHSLESDL